jgi:hypothetical protein
MTEEEWLVGTEPKAMLELLVAKVSDRKLRLFACACCRRIWSLILDERWRTAVKFAEDYADQRCSRERLQVEWDAEGMTAVGHAVDGATAMDAGWGAGWTARNVVEAIVSDDRHSLMPKNFGDMTAWLAFTHERKRSIEHAERTIQTTLLRDIVGNPFRPLNFDPSWQTLSAVRLAQSIYDERAFDKMPELADALERAGCHDEAILGHCREPGEHVRGCWVVDLVLGKE